MKNNKFKYSINILQCAFLLCATMLLLHSCEDTIDVDLEEDGTQLVVDAWLNDQSGTQVIKLRRTIPFFTNEFAPEVTGATVYVADSDSTVYEFVDDNNDGDYVWTSPNNTSFVTEGKDYVLYIELNGDDYIAFSHANRTIPVDSITYEFRDDFVGQPDGIYAEIHATDLVGEGDVYWIKTFKNGVFLNKPQEINIAYDGAFNAGSNSDGILFIPPIRQAINRVPDAGDDAIDDDDIPPYAIGDSIRVEIHSLTQEAFFYWLQAAEQMTQGDNGLFATPVTNIPTNIVADSENAKEMPVGFFCVSLVSSSEIEIQ